ncbi:MAG: DUF3800 domain-containing protein [Planctomycetes bacterium]|nr:DUF3800 domain-containing protein [Planctomycetota bacterium]
MYVLYLDASGTPELQDRNTRHYVLVGLCMHEGSWFALDRRLRAVKQRYCLADTDPDQFEIHVKEFAGTIKEQDEIPDFQEMAWAERRARVLELRKQKLLAEQSNSKRNNRRDRYRNSAPYVHLSREERSQLLDDAIEVIAGYDSIRLFGEAIDKSHPAVLSGTADLREQAFTQVVARFDTFLQKKASWRRRDSPRGRVDHGLLMHDHDASTQSVVEPLFRKYRQKGHSFGLIKHVIDVPFFGSSDKVGGLQLADVAAYVVRRYLDKGAAAGSHEERQFMQIF